MVSQRTRWRLSGGGLVVVGVVAAALLYVQLDVPLASALFVLVAITGGLMLLRRARASAASLGVVGVLALLSGAVGYLEEGLVTLTVLYLLLGLVSSVQGVQLYRNA
jgi:hypothetical protein